MATGVCYAVFRWFGKIGANPNLSPSDDPHEAPQAPERDLPDDFFVNCFEAKKSNRVHRKYNVY